jgi:hypothetical protein
MPPALTLDSPRLTMRPTTISFPEGMHMKIQALYTPIAVGIAVFVAIMASGFLPGGSGTRTAAADPPCVPKGASCITPV